MTNQNIPKLRFKGFKGEWDERKIGNLVSIYDGTHQTPNYVKEGISFYSVEHLTANNFSNTKFISESVFEKENKRVSIEKGDILMTRIGDIGTARIIDWDVKASFYVSLALIKKSEKINSYFLSQYISTSFFQKELWKRTIHVAFPKKINLGEINECLLSITSTQEQQKIAGFLSKVDEWIGNLREQKENLEKYKKGMMQKIFAQKIKFKDENGKEFEEWKNKRLGDVTKLFSSRNNNLVKANVYSVTNTKGFVLQTDQFERVIAGNNLTGYKIIKKNDFAYNPARINVGSIAHFTDEIGIISSLYVCFRTTEELNDSYLEYFLKLSKTKFYFNVYGEGGVRIYLWYPLFSKIKINVPSLKEQQKIAEFLTSIDKLIDLKQEQIAKAEEWKKGLMQGLFV